MNSNRLLLVFGTEMFVVALFLALLFHFGASTGTSWQALSLGLCLYLFWHFYHVFQLIEWLKSKKCTHLPISFGIWREIFGQLVELQQVTHNRQKKLIKFLDNYRAFFKVIPDSVVILNQDNEIEWFNKNTQIFLGIKKKKSIGKNITKILKEPELAHLLANIHDDDYTELPSPVDKNKIYSIRIIPFIKGSRLLLARDISRLYWIDKMLSRYQDSK